MAPSHICTRALQETTGKSMESVSTVATVFISKKMGKMNPPGNLSWSIASWEKRRRKQRRKTRLLRVVRVEALHGHESISLCFYFRDSFNRLQLRQEVTFGSKIGIFPGFKTWTSANGSNDLYRICHEQIVSNALVVHDCTIMFNLFISFVP